MTGTYVMEAIPPYCKEIRMRVSVVLWLGNRVLLRNEEISTPGTEFLIETDFSSFLPDIPNEKGNQP